ncbi:SMI1/KNR4 family protein [Streptomyces sp. NPDC086989]|uniref:SMI1/KNR4 family protein n=1 Tax=Streptomyces sp. NPDC086989 TaxID=3365764 RepID=UPI0037F38619
MDSFVAQLRELLVARSEGGDQVNWGEVEQQYGFQFPDDYKEFVAVFGEGSIEETLWITIPIAAPDPMARCVDRLPDHVLEFPEAHEWADEVAAQKYRLEDVLIWGETSEADILGWLTCSTNPDDWPLAVFSRDEASWSVHFCSMSEFLVKLLRADFEKFPISTRRLSSLEQARFIRTREGGIT